jgi:hypothetical protein
MSDSPSTTEPNGRGGNGRFTPGNKHARGNPHAKRVARLRSALLKAVSPADLREVVVALLSAAKAGDVAAARELLQRLLGPPEAADLIQRMDELEQRIAAATETESRWRN